jgi:DNA (cytosine-5)-methyltransferase 1
MRVLDLFSGIGGFSLGLERAGFTTVAFCEIEPYCRAVLKKHWPHVPCYEDVRTLTAERLAADGISVDVICGGFPCQDISTAGNGQGLAGERSGLWSEYARLIRDIRPRYVIVENVAALLGRGLDAVLGQLVSLGYDAEWHCIPAASIGAPHRRDRIWIVAYPAGAGNREPEQAVSIGDECLLRGWPQVPAYTGRLCEALADTVSPRLEGRAGIAGDTAEQLTAPERDGEISDANSEPLGWLAEPRSKCGDWLPEPDVGRVAHGVPSRVDRLKALGNAVVPQIPEIIGRAILASEAA